MEDERFKEEMIRMMGTVIQKLDGHDARFDNYDVRFDKLEKDGAEIKSVQKEHTKILKEHTQILNRVDSKTDSIAEKVLEHEVRIAKAEQNIEDLQGGVH
jgi:peptidoglycan hydrolase CwlO-like protein